MENTINAQEIMKNWLRSNSQEVCYIKVDKYHHYAFFKTRIKEGIDMIFRYETDDDHIIPVQVDPKYEGVYKVDEDRIYGGEYALDEIFGEDEMNKTAFHKVRYEFMEKVRAGVDAKARKIEDDIAVTEEDRARESSYAEDKARGIYINSIETVYNYECEYEDERFQKKFLEYLLNPDAVVERSVNEFYANHLDSIKREIVRIKIVKELVEQYERGENTFVLALRNIIRSIPKNCKMVNVTTDINGIELTFKYEADMLKRDCRNSYSTWYIPSSDRYKYEAMYGGYRDFTPEEITKITYSRKVLYERE